MGGQKLKTEDALNEYERNSMNKVRRITTAEAAALMQKDALFVREAMRRDLLNIGVAMQLDGRKRWTFFISPPLLADYLGITVDELWTRLEEVRRNDQTA